MDRQINVAHFLSVGLMEGKSLNDCIGKLQAGLVPTLKKNWCFWPAIQAAIYGFVPIRHRLMAVMAFNFIWSIVLSSCVNRPTPPSAKCKDNVLGGGGSVEGVTPAKR